MPGPTYRAVATIRRLPDEPETTRVETALEHLRKAESDLLTRWQIGYALAGIRAAIRALEGKS